MMPSLRARNSRAELTTLAAGLVLLALAATLLLGPRLHRLAALRRQAAADAATATRIEQELAPYAQALAGGPGPGARRVLGADGSRGAVPGLLDRLSQLGRDCALEVTALTPRASGPRRLPGSQDAGGGEAVAFRVLTVVVEAEASFGGLGRYLEALAGLDVPLTVLALHVEPAGGDRVAARFTLGTWVIDDGTGAPAPEVGSDEAA